MTKALSGGEATGDQRGSNGTRAAEVSPEFRADPSFTYLLTDNLVEANKEILRLRDEKAALIEALSELVLYHDVPSEAQGPVVLPLLRAAFAAIHKATRQEGSEEGDRLGRLKEGAGCEPTPETSSQEGGE